ncbi:MAG: hypothetical protein ACRDXX_00220 [Stackebrandtia sp.]
MDSVPFTATRRTLLRSLPGVAAGAALPGLIGVGAAATAASLNAEADDFDMMRGQWRELHVTDGYDPTDPEISPVLSAIDDDAAAWWSKMETGDGRDYLWPDARLEVEESFAIKRSFERLYAMALAWATPGASHHGDADLLADVVAALDWMVAHYYTEDGEVVGNWYEWKISGPMAFNNAVVLLYDQLSGEQVSAYGRAVGHYTPEPVFTAANRALTSSVVVGRGVLTGDSDTVSLGVDGLDSVLTIVTSGEGFYPDGSFIQHEFYPYVGAYGTLLLDAVAPIFRTTAGTSWQLDPEVVYTWLRDAFDPVIWRGALMDMVSGRIISRYDELDHYRARYALISGLALAALASPEQAEWLLPMLKEWLVSDEHPDPKPMHLVPGLLDGIELRDDDSVSRRGELVGSKVYQHQDRILHR